MQSKQKKQKGKNTLSFPEQTIPFLAAHSVNPIPGIAHASQTAATTIRLATANKKQIDVTRIGAGCNSYAHRRIRIGASVLLNRYTA